MLAVVIHGAWQALRWRHRQMAAASMLTVAAPLAASTCMHQLARVPQVLHALAWVAVMAALGLAWGATLGAGAIAASWDGSTGAALRFAATRSTLQLASMARRLWPGVFAIAAAIAADSPIAMAAASLVAIVSTALALPSLLVGAVDMALARTPTGSRQRARELMHGHRGLAHGSSLLAVSAFSLPVIAGLVLGRLLLGDLLPAGMGGRALAFILGTPGTVVAIGLATSLHRTLVRAHAGIPLEVPIYDHAGMVLSMASASSTADTAIVAPASTKAPTPRPEPLFQPQQQPPQHLPYQVIDGTLRDGQPVSAWIALPAASPTRIQLAWSAGPPPTLAICDQRGMRLPATPLDASGMATVQAAEPGWHAAHVMAGSPTPQNVRLIVHAPATR